MKVVYWGSGDFGLPALTALKHSRHELAGIVTGPDKPRGRHLALSPNPVKSWALKHGVTLLDAERAASSGADLFVVIAYGVILPEKWIAAPRLGTLNAHASLLPAYRGASPIHAALLAGDTRTGVTVMRMVKKLDAGDSVLQISTPITDSDDFETLSARLSTLSAGAVLEAVDLLESGRAVLTPQDERLATYAPKIRKEDGRLDWSLPARELFGRIRAFRRWPKAYAFAADKRLIMLAASVAEPPALSSPPGRILHLSPQRGMVVACGQGALSITEIQPEGKKPMSAAQFAAGSPLKAGDTLA